MAENTLYYGDNLDILRKHIGGESADLIYLDPPFNSNATYNILFPEQNGTPAASQAKAFEDTWEWGPEAGEAYEEVVEAGGQVSLAMQAFHTLLGRSNMLAYLAMMAPRLMELRQVMKPTASIYLHCDPTASHYLKLLMDAVFGPDNFRREIIWSMSAAAGYKSLANNFIRGHDVIFYYARSGSVIFNKSFNPYSQKQLARFTGVDEEGRRYKTITKTRRLYLDEAKGVPITDVWSDIANFQTVVNAKEKQGYPTQKPEALLERIIKASSNKGDVVLDPFCGCGTTIAAAQKLGRRWVGIDITYAAIAVIKKRLKDAYGKSVLYQVIGEPISLPDAEKLAAEDPYQFQWWALDLVDARPTEEKKGADKGIDGRLYFHASGDDRGETKQVIFSVKAGHVTAAHVRDLRGCLDREKAEFGCVLSFNRPTRAMRTEATGVGFYEWTGEIAGKKRYPRLQLLTIAELLDGRSLELPPHESVTFKRAPRAKKQERQLDIGEAES